MLRPTTAKHAYSPYVVESDCQTAFLGYISHENSVVETDKYFVRFRASTGNLIMNSTFPSKTEERANQASSLPNFSHLALEGIREDVKVLLGQIGRSDGIFLTYTRHDITHIDAMLSMADWLIPEKTASAMSPVDWLMITLSVYFHDLGLLVTQNEFSARNVDSRFLEFKKRVTAESDSEFSSRLEQFDGEARDQFLYQEFVRSSHASRIRKWIQGRYISMLPEAVQAQAKAVHSLVEKLPPRFIDHLGLVCESHHQDDLNLTSKYPIFASYGNKEEESCNVQYSALILRTLDLLHVTKDRTPSLEYRLLRISDPKGVEEWDKQTGTFSVFRDGRNFDPEDGNSHKIVFGADFTEERPFFALSEYLSYVESQISITKRWADSSQETRDGENYWFPWHGIRRDVTVEGHPPQSLRFEFDRPRLLQLLVGHTLYNDETVALRELVQNSLDATRLYSHLKTDKSREDLSIRVNWNPSTLVLSISDSGTGMTEEIIKGHLMKVGSSYYSSESFQQQHPGFAPISRFGIGILTCFMVSDDVEIITKRDEKALRLRMASVHSDYLLKELPAEHPEAQGIKGHGTVIRLRLRRGTGFSKRSPISVLQEWIQVPAVPVVYVEDRQKPVSIGADDVATALRKAISKDNNRFSDLPYRVLTSKVTRDDAELHLAYLVREDVKFGSSFVRSDHQQNAGFAATCIEGIKIENSLPLIHPNFIGMLNITGSKGLRPTVSRSQLERDEEFSSIAMNCVEMLCEHISSEITRVSEDKGHPLSRASTTAKWLSASLRSSATQREYVSEQLKTLLSVVVERPGTTLDEFNRVLISQLELESLERFYTIESRIMENLGIISRDLGRELGFVEFVRRFASDFPLPKMENLIVDSHYDSEHLQSSHYIAFADVNREHQRVVFEWRKGGSLLSTARKYLLSAEDVDLLSFYKFAMPGVDSEYIGEIRRGILAGGVYVAEVIDDGEAIVDALGTQHGLVLRQGSALSDLITALVEEANAYFESGNSHRAARLLLLSLTICMQVDTGRAASRSRVYGDSFPAASAYEAIRAAVLRDPATAKWERQLPEKIYDLVSNVEKYSASKSWLDYFGTRR